MILYLPLDTEILLYSIFIPPLCRLAGRWWCESLQTLFKAKDPLNSWRKLVGVASRCDGRHPSLESYGVWGCLTAAMLATKLAK